MLSCSSKALGAHDMLDRGQSRNQSLSDTCYGCFIAALVEMCTFFLVFAYSLIQRRTVDCVTAKLAGSQKLTPGLEAVFEAVVRQMLPGQTQKQPWTSMDTITPQMSTAHGSRGDWQMKPKGLQSVVPSPIVPQPTVCKTLSVHPWDSKKVPERNV